MASELLEGLTWMRRFRECVAGRDDLAEEDIDTMIDSLEARWADLSLDDYPDEVVEAQLTQLVDKLVGNINASVAVANAVVKKATEPKMTNKSVICSSFPVSDASSLPAVADPLQRYRDLMDELRGHGDYRRVRDEFCQLSIILNTQGMLAPAFRPLLNAKRKHGDPIFKEIHRDRLVIDCHWLHATSQFVSMRPKDAEFQPMFRKGGNFPFELAWEFAGNEWTKDHRTRDMMRLTPFQQFQLAALQSEDVSAIIKKIDHGSRKEGRSIPAPISVFEQRLNAWCERDSRIYNHRDGYIAVWKARSYLGPKESVRQVGALAALMLGEKPKDDKTIRDREENIVRRILGG